MSDIECCAYPDESSDSESNISESNDSESNDSERVNCKCGVEGQGRIVGGNVVPVRNIDLRSFLKM